LIFSIDTSALLDGWRRHYPPDVFISIWKRIDELIAAGELRATDEVRGELERKDDDVFRWAKSREGFFVPIDEAIQIEVANVLRLHPRLVDHRKGRSGADPFVIALALRDNSIVVTGESRTGRLLEKPRIPDVCEAMDVRCIGLLDLFRTKGWKL
jgi:hypothetical protein